MFLRCCDGEQMEQRTNTIHDDKKQKKTRYNRTRTGCITCRIRHVKCDETKPACLRCRKTGRKCDGYAPDKTWRFELLPKYESKELVSIRTCSQSSNLLPSTPLLTDRNETAPSSETTKLAMSNLIEGDHSAAHLTNPQLMATPDLSKPYLSALLGIFCYRMLPDRLTSLPSTSTSSQLPVSSHVVTPCATWVTGACNLATERTNCALQNALLAVVFCILGAESSEPNLITTAMEMYRRSLRGIRQELEPLLAGTRKTTPSPTYAQELFLTCHAAAMFELFVNRSWPDTMKHVQGIGSFIDFLTNRNCKTEMGDFLMQDYRLFEIGYCIVDRRSATWKVTNDQKNKKKSKPFETKQSNLQLLLGIGDRIVVDLVRFEEILKQQQTQPQIDTPAMNLEFNRLFSELTKALSEIEDWFVKFHSIFDPVFLPPIPLNDDDNEENNNYNALPFSRFELSVSWIYAQMFKVNALDACIHIRNLLQQPYPSPLPLTAELRSIPILPLQKPARSSSTTASPPPPPPSPPSLPLHLDLRAHLRSTAHLLSRSIPYILMPDKGATGRSIAVFPLESAFRALDAERSRLKRDLTGFDDTYGGKAKGQHAKAEEAEAKALVVKAALEQNLADRRRCAAMAVRAKGFGVPLYAEREGRAEMDIEDGR